MGNTNCKHGTTVAAIHIFVGTLITDKTVQKWEISVALTRLRHTDSIPNQLRTA